MSDMNALADRLMAAIEQGDLATIRTCYTEDAKIWHNFDEIEQSVDQNLASLGWLLKRLPERRYQIVSRKFFGDGYVQQHVLTGKLSNGEAFRLPACLVCSIRDGRIARLEEYLDLSATAALRA